MLKRMMLLMAMVAVVGMMLGGCAKRALVRFTSDGFEVSGDLSDDQVERLVTQLQEQMSDERAHHDTLDARRTGANVTFVKSQAKYAEDHPSTFDDGRTRTATGHMGMFGGVGFGGYAWTDSHRGVVQNRSEYSLYAVIRDELGNQLRRTAVIPPGANSGIVMLNEGEYKIDFHYASSGKVYTSNRRMEIDGERADQDGGLDWFFKIQ